MTRPLTLLPVLALLFSAACAGCEQEPPPDGGPSAGDDAGLSPDGGADDGGLGDAGPPSPDAGEPDAGPPDAGPPDAGPPDAGPQGDFDGELPPPIEHAGVAYVAHFYTDALYAIRLDRSPPEREPAYTTEGVSVSGALDPVNDLLFLVHDVDRTVEVLQLSRPANPEAPTVAPESIATIDTSPFIPQQVRVDPYTHRLFVVASPPPTGTIIEEYNVRVYDLSDPTTPALKAEQPEQLIPVAISLDVDAARGLLFVVGYTTDLLHVYDVSGDELVPLPGDPVDLRALYPEENNTGFQVRQLTVDARRARVYAARSQGALSELIALRYPQGVPQNGARYGDAYGHQDLEAVEDFFDVSEPVAERPNLLDAFKPVVDPVRGDVLLVANAWNGSMSSTLVVPLSFPELQAAESCGEYEGFGCFYRGYADGNAVSYKQTDGAACFDATRRILVGTSIQPSSPDDPGLTHLFAVDDELGMAPLLSATGGNLAMSGLPIVAACH